MREVDENNKKMLSYGFNPEEESRDDALEKFIQWKNKCYFTCTELSR